MPQLLNKSLKKILRLLLIFFYLKYEEIVETKLGVVRAERKCQISEKISNFFSTVFS